MSDTIYLDYAASTPVDPAVAEAMAGFLTRAGTFANPSSAAHAPGRAAAAAVEHARAQVAALIGAQPAEIIFTSGATESDNLAVLGVARANADRGRHIVTSRIEHRAVLDACRQLQREGFSVTYLTPDANGRILVPAVAAALRRETTLVSIMHVNNEIGVLEDIAAIGAICRARGVTFHSDAAQSAGRVPINVATLAVDLLSLTAHKIYGPKGIGALYVRPAARGALQALSFGGGQEHALRPGTLPTHQIAGFGVAAALALRDLNVESRRASELAARLWRGLEKGAGAELNGAAAERIPHIVNVSFAGVEGESLLAGLHSLAVSTGSACSSASGEPSYVLKALGRSTARAESSLRFSFGRFTTEAEIDAAVSQVRRQLEKLRRISPAGSGEDTGAASASATFPPVDADPLSPATRELFETLPGAGRIADSEGRVLRGEAGGATAESWVRFHLLVEGDSVKAARFQAVGCPHTLAACAWIVARLPGRRRGATQPGTPQEWAEALSAPVEKLGRLLTVEDALRAAFQHWT